MIFITLQSRSAPCAMMRKLMRKPMFDRLHDDSGEENHDEESQQRAASPAMSDTNMSQRSVAESRESRPSMASSVLWDTHLKPPTAVRDDPDGDDQVTVYPCNHVPLFSGDGNNKLDPHEAVPAMSERACRNPKPYASNSCSALTALCFQ